MVEFNVIVGHEAKQNLQSKENESEQIAEKVKDGIIESIATLSKMPQRHGIVQEIKNEKYEYRRVLKWSYKIIFNIDEESSTVKIVDIIHSKRSPKILQDKFAV